MRAAERVAALARGSVPLNDRGRRCTSAEARDRDSRWVGRNSFYAEHGDWFVFACACATALAISLLGLAGLPAPAAPKGETP